MYLGIDVQADISSYTWIVPGEKPANGRVKLDGFETLLDQTGATAIACEYTGRLAEPFTEIALRRGVKVYYLDTVSRAYYTRLFGQTSKTDKQDAKTIARVFASWITGIGSEAFEMNPHLFIDADRVRHAWRLRSILFEIEKMKEMAESCQAKALIASRTGRADAVERWQTISHAFPVKALEDERDAFIDQHFAGEVELLQTIPGIGPTIAPWLIAVLQPIERFETVWEAKRYVGLNPRQRDTGKKTGKQKVSKTGNAQLRGMMYQAIVGQTKESVNSHWNDVYKRQAATGKPGKKCVVAVQERLFRTCYYILKNKTPYYDPLRPAQKTLDSHLISQTTAAKMLNVSRQYIGKLASTGKLRSEVWHGKNHVLRADIDALLAAKQPDPKPDDPRKEQQP